MFPSQALRASDPLIDVHALIGDIHADVQVGGDGNVLAASFDNLVGVDADVDVELNAGCNDSELVADASIAVGPHIDVDACATLGDGIGLDADIDLDGALLNAAASMDAVLDIGPASLGDGGCTDTGASTGLGDINIPSFGPLLSSIELPVMDLSCGDNA